MATPIRAQDREHFEIVQQALAVDGLHVAINSTDPNRLADYAGTLARSLASRYGLQVEAYRPGRLESLVADLMLYRYDGALSRISGAAGQGRQQAGGETTACVLFIPDAETVRLQDFAQLARIASGMRQLRLVAMFGGSIPFERDARLRPLGTQLARWDLDADDADGTGEVAAAGALRSTPARTAAQHESTGRPAAPRRLRPWLAASAAAVAAASTTAAVMLAVQPFADHGGMAAGTPVPPPAPTLTRSGTVQLAGEPPADFRRAAPAPADAADAADVVEDDGAAGSIPAAGGGGSR